MIYKYTIQPQPWYLSLDTYPYLLSLLQSLLQLKLGNATPIHPELPYFIFGFCLMLGLPPPIQYPIGMPASLNLHVWLTSRHFVRCIRDGGLFLAWSGIWSGAGLVGGLVYWLVHGLVWSGMRSGVWGVCYGAKTVFIALFSLSPFQLIEMQMWRRTCGVLYIVLYCMYVCMCKYTRVMCMYTQKTLRYSLRLPTVTYMFGWPREWVMERG